MSHRGSQRRIGDLGPIFGLRNLTGAVGRRAGDPGRTPLAERRRTSLSNGGCPAAARVSLFAIPLAGCSGQGIVDPAGPVAEANRWILFDSLAIMLVIVIPTILVAVAFAWWFRAGNAKASRQPDFVYSGRLELLVWGIPLLVILFLGGVIWVGSHRQDPSSPLQSQTRPIEVDVVALDWKWLFVNPEAGIASVNRIVIPVGAPIRFRITSASVMNAFFVPRLGSMIYAMNGMETRLHLMADRPGRYRGMSSHFSGDGFSDMKFEVIAVPADEYRERVRRTRRSDAPRLDRKAYDVLSRQGVATVSEYARIDGSLFDAIVAQRVPPSRGPAQSTRDVPR